MLPELLLLIQVRGKFKKEVYTSMPALPPFLKRRHDHQQSRLCTTFKIAGWKNGESCVSYSVLGSGSGDHLLFTVQGRQFRRPLLELSRQCDQSDHLSSPASASRLPQTSTPAHCPLHPSTHTPVVMLCGPVCLPHGAVHV